jgi:hypothetical protein
MSKIIYNRCAQRVVSAGSKRNSDISIPEDIGALSRTTNYFPGRYRQMQQNQTNHMTVNGVTIPYMTRGQGEPVVFVHGALADYRMWLPHCETVPANYQAITLTQRYFGQSSLPTEPHKFGIGVHAMIWPPLLKIWPWGRFILWLGLMGLMLL